MTKQAQPQQKPQQQKAQGQQQQQPKPQGQQAQSRDPREKKKELFQRLRDYIFGEEFEKKLFDVASAKVTNPNDKNELVRVRSLLDKYRNGVMSYIWNNDGEKEDDLNILLCTPHSIGEAILVSFDMELPVDERHLAYLVPYKGLAKFRPGYRGYVYKMKQANATTEIDTGIVFEGDRFEVSISPGKVAFVHEPNDPFNANYAKIEGAWCYIAYMVGDRWFEKLERLPMEDIQKIREAAKTGKVWGTWWSEQIKKAVLRRAAKVPFTLAIASLDGLDNDDFDLHRNTKEEKKPAAAHVTQHLDLEQKLLSQSAMQPMDMIRSEEKEGVDAGRDARQAEAASGADGAEQRFTLRKENPADGVRDSGECPDATGVGVDAEEQPSDMGRDNPAVAEAEATSAAVSDATRPDPQQDVAGTQAGAQQTADPVPQWDGCLYHNGVAVVTGIKEAEGAAVLCQYMNARLEKKADRLAFIKANPAVTAYLVRQKKQGQIDDIHALAQEGIA